MSNFDPNAILRGAQLTLVGGTDRLQAAIVLASTDTCSQLIVPSRTQGCSLQTTTVKQPSLWLQESPFESSSPYL